MQAFICILYRRSKSMSYPMPTTQTTKNFLPHAINLRWAGAFNPIPGGGGSLRTPFRFSCAIAKRCKILSSYWVSFSNHSLRIFQQNKTKKLPGQVRSDHHSGLVDPTSEKFAITSELVFFAERFLLFRCSLQHQYVLFEYLKIVICICGLGSGQSRDLYITSLWENNEMRPASSKQVKTTHFLEDCDRLTDL